MVITVIVIIALGVAIEQWRYRCMLSAEAAFWQAQQQRLDRIANARSLSSDHVAP